MTGLSVYGRGKVTGQSPVVLLLLITRTDQYMVDSPQVLPMSCFHSSLHTKLGHTHTYYHGKILIVSMLPCQVNIFLSRSSAEQLAKLQWMGFYSLLEHNK